MNVLKQRRWRARLGTWGLWSLMTVGVLGPGAARAQDAGQDFRDAREAYSRADYQAVVRLLEPMVGGEVPSISDQILVRESRKYLGAAYALIGQRSAALIQFRELLRNDPQFEDYPLDEAYFPNEVQGVLHEVQRAMTAERDVEASARRRAQATAEQRRREALLALVAQAQEPELDVPHDPLLAWAPFGVGQFQNGNEGLGVFFAVGQIVTLLGSIVSLLAWIPLDAQYTAGFRISPDLLDGLVYLNWASDAALALLYAASVVEGNVNFVPSHRTRQPQRIPDDVLQGLELVGSPGGLGLRLRF